MPVPESIEQLKRKRNQFNLSRSLIARHLKVPEVTVYRWESGICKPSPVYQERIETWLRIIKEIEQEAAK